MANFTRDPGAPAGDHRLGDLRVHIAYPEHESTTGVLLYPTIMGLDDAMRGLAADFAVLGLTAVVWDPYKGLDAAGSMMDMLARSKTCEDTAMIRDLQIITEVAQRQLGLASLGGIGWCFGGRVGLLHAGADSRVQALAAYNPTIYSVLGHVILGGTVRRSEFPGKTLDEYAFAARIAGAVQIARPEHDFTASAEYDRLIETLSARSGPTFYDFHPDAGHGFSYSPGEANAKAHRYAWALTLAMFQTALSA